MTREDALLKLQEMKGRFNSGFSSIDRQWIDMVYFDLFGKDISNRGCSSCYKDAYLEIYQKIKTLKEMPKKSNYVLKAGALITFFGEPIAYSNANLTDEIAERYLAQNLDLITSFQTFPLDYPQRVEAYKAGVAYVPTEDPEMTENEALKARVAELEAENQRLKAELAILQDAGNIKAVAAATEAEAVVEAESAPETETKAKKGKKTDK